MTQENGLADILRLHNAWNEAYLRRDRSPLREILADDFTGVTPSGEPITKALLMAGDPGTGCEVDLIQRTRSGYFLRDRNKPWASQAGC